MAAPGIRHTLVAGTSEIVFADPSLGEGANRAIGTLLTLTCRDYLADKEGGGVEHDVKLRAFDQELERAVAAIFAQSPFDRQPGWVSTYDQPPFTRGDNLLSLVYRASAGEVLLSEVNEGFTHDKVTALTQALLEKNVPADIGEELGDPNPNSPLKIYMDRFADLDTTHDFRVMELLTQ